MGAEQLHMDGRCPRCFRRSHLWCSSGAARDRWSWEGWDQRRADDLVRARVESRELWALLLAALAGAPQRRACPYPDGTRTPHAKRRSRARRAWRGRR